MISINLVKEETEKLEDKLVIFGKEEREICELKHVFYSLFGQDELVFYSIYKIRLKILIRGYER